MERKITPLFPFGHGLSYSTFEYSAMEVARQDLNLDFTFTITNTGKVAGATSAQLYLSSPPSSLTHPIRHLGGVAATETLAPGASQKVTISITRRELSHWDDLIHSWSVEQGTWKAFLAEDSLAPEQSTVEFEVKGRYEWTGL